MQVEMQTRVRANWSSGAARRSVLRLGALAPTAALVAACGGATASLGGQANSGAPRATKDPVTVEYWTMWPQERVDILQPQLPIFEQRTKYISANITMVGDYRPKLRTAIVAGTPPDASIGEVFSAALYADQKVMLDLAPLVKRDRIDVQRDYVINGFEDWCGRLYTFPLDGFSFALVYNKTMFRERGVPDPWDVQKGEWTWDDFTQAVVKLTRDDVVAFKPDDHTIARGYHPFIVANGGEYFDYDTMKYQLDQPKAIDGMEWLYDLVARRKVATTAAQTADLNKATNSDPFAAGRIAITGDNGVRPKASAMQAIGDRFEWDLVPYPRRRKGDPSYGLIGGNGDWAYAKAKHPEEGYELIKFFGGDEVQGGIGKSRILPPAQWKARRDPNGFLKAAPKHMSVYNDVWESRFNRTNRAYHYTDLELAPQLDALVNAAFRDERTMKDAMVEANRLGNSQVQFGERCYRPPWKKR
jgi:multiple sugar transport system substrate-binding protein